MHLFLIGLLALGSARAFSVVRTFPQPHPHLVAYSPARGEFPVVDGVAQGYVRYFDGTGAERLLAYNYPEPLNGIRDLATFSLTRSGVEQESQQTALFRAWCEQRYQAMRLELDRLRAQGQKPSASMLSQFEPLEQIVKLAAFEAVPGLSPEVQRARDEQLRIWNEARLKVLRAEQAQQLQTNTQTIPVIYGQQDSILVKTSIPQAAKPIETPQTHSYGQFDPSQEKVLIKTALQSPQPVEETLEVKLAREDHLKQYNEVLLRKPAPEATVLKKIPIITLESQPMVTDIFKPSSFASQQAPQPVEETPEVKLAREDHLKQFNEALIRQSTVSENPNLKNTPTQPQAIIFAGQQHPQPVEESPEVKRAREEHFKQFNEAILRKPMEVQQQPLIPFAHITPSAPQELQPIQDTPEVKLAREQHLLLLSQAKVQAEDKVADIADMIRLEERDNERLQMLDQRLRDDKEAEIERQREVDRLREDTRLQEAERLKIEQEDRLRLNSERLAEQQELIQLKSTNLENDSPQYLRKAEQFKIISNQAQPQSQPQPNIVAQQQQVQNGFFLRIQTNQPSAIQTSGEPISSPTIVFSEKTPNPFLIRYTTEPQPQALQPLLASTVTLPLPIATKLKLETGHDSTPTSELDKATKEHFRAHEIALEQLRLANLKNPWSPDCQH
ncbi:hypothetical protein KR009_012300 [Drosophila setifemur]|nr:hypothetical protein KR009_012300 [Drosophila setifemur]